MKYKITECDELNDIGCQNCTKPRYPNTYLKPGPNINCGPSYSNYLACDPCTKTTELLNIASEEKDCPSFSDSMGRPPGISDSTARQFPRPLGVNYCLPCKSCKGITNKNGTPLYFAQSYAPSDFEAKVNCVTIPSAQCIYTHQTQSGTFSPGPMIFVYGMKRKWGSYTESIQTLSLTNKDTLPTYENCALDFKLPVGYRRRNDAVLNQDIEIYNNYVSFNSEAQDCSEQYIGECDTGYYVSLRRGIQIRCTLCPGAPLSPGGFMEYCECPPGFANQSAILSALQPLVSPNLRVRVRSASLNECVSCLNNVQFVNDRGDEQHEQISCSSRGIERCKSNEFIPNLESGCQACEAGYIPTLDKTQCIRCEAGAYSNGTTCVDCDGTTEYCPEKGMMRPRAKNRTCPDGKLFIGTPQSNIEDNRCEECPSECQGKTYIVFASGHNKSNSCSQSESRRTYFTCYDPATANLGQIASGEKYRTVYNYSLLEKRAFITIDGCNKYRIPDHADWVDVPENQGDKQCVFACKHGWNRQLGEELQQRIRNMVYYSPNLRHLQQFLKGIENPTFGVVEEDNTIKKKVNWPEPLERYSDEGWEQAKDASAILDNERGRYYKLKNTFLYVDHIMDEISGNSTFMNGLCLNPTEAYDHEGGCPVGFAVTTTANNMNCAMEAREGRIFSIKTSNGDSNEYVNAILTRDKKIKCAMKSYDDSKWIPYDLCKSCLDLKHQEINAVFDARLSVRNSVRKRHMLKWLDRMTWYRYYFGQPMKHMPYEFIKTNCETSHGANFFSIRMEDGHASDIQAALPCNLNKGESNGGEQFCKEMFGEQYAYDISGTCMYGGSPCTECNASRNLIPSYQVSTWSTIRKNWPLEFKVCMYSCGVNFTSNKEWKTYGTTPCIPCEYVIQSFFSGGIIECRTNGVGSYFNFQNNMDLCNRGEGLGEGISEYTPQCSACFPITTSVPLVFSTERLFTTNEKCLALCPPDLYRTIIMNQTSSLEEETLSPVEQASILECRLCTNEHVIACNNSNCSQGYFRQNEKRCSACNTSVCKTPGFYRTQCPPNAISDSFCAPCEERKLLYNNYAAAMAFRPSTLLWKALNESQLDRSRRWHSRNSSLPSIFVSDEGCAVSCVNNYVWIDFSTGKPPSPIASDRLLPYYACIPCNSDFIRVPSGTSNMQLYSVWNYSGALVPQPNPRDQSSVFAQIQKSNMTGGCYLCPPNTNTIPSVDTMCQTIPGFGQNTILGVPVEITLRSIDTANTKLTSSEIFTTFVFRSKRTPVVMVSDSVYFTCCRKNDQECKVFEKKEIDKNQAILLGPTSFYGQCTNNATGANYTASQQRRLLQKEEVAVEKCLVGQYNHLRGGTICFDCPLGASTVEPYHGINTRQKCECLPGYYAIRNTKGGALERCEPCGFNKHRSVYMRNDSFCDACPRGKITPSETSANCYCDAGSYPAENDTTCIICEAGGYCESGASRIACPENSWSAAGARTRSDCKCKKEGYYGSLANPGSVCHRVPPTMQCEGGRCECAIGWYPVYKTSADGLVTVMRCMTECNLGYYAVINPITFAKLECRPCPLNTYSSSRQTIYAGEGRSQCTPCPPKFQTLSVGSVAPSQCVCLRGVKNTNTSECGSCPENTYLQTLQGVCMACPEGATAPSGSVGLSSCVCPRGTHATFGDSGELQCEPCPLNTYAMSAGFSCTRCPDGMVTLTHGSTSIRQCVCSGGKVQYAGMCV